MKEIISIALWSAEKVANQIIQSDRYVLNKLAPFAGRSLEIETSSPNFSIVVFFGFDRLSLSGISAELLNITPDAKVSGETKTHGYAPSSRVFELPPEPASQRLAISQRALWRALATQETRHCI